MQEHYQLSDEAFLELQKKVTIAQMFKAIKHFDPFDTKAPINFLGLLYYVDSKGDFNMPPKFPHKIIALAVFDRLPIKEKIAVAEYIELHDNDYVELWEWENE